MVSIMSILSETDLGRFKISVALLLYRSLFLSTVLFNSQAWSKMRKKDLEQLQRLQSKFLKRIVGVPYSTCNSFTFLELGVLPIEYEIDKRRLMYLHRILNLDIDDPVYLMFQNMRTLSVAGEHNWWTDMEKVLKRYDIAVSLDEIQCMGKDAFRGMVKKAVEKTALSNLVSACSNMKKTSDLRYSSLKMQTYLNKQYPQHSKVIFQCRAKILDIKEHRTYKYDDDICRGCGTAGETIEHILNCPGIQQQEDTKQTLITFTMMENLDESEILWAVQRICRFMDKIDS